MYEEVKRHPIDVTSGLTFNSGRFLDAGLEVGPSNV